MTHLCKILKPFGDIITVLPGEEATLVLAISIGREDVGGDWGGHLRYIQIFIYPG